MEIQFYHFPVAILAKGITETSLYEILYFAIGSYLEKCHATIIEARDVLSLSGGNEERSRAVFEYYKNSRAKTSIRSDQYWQWRNNVDKESENSKLLLLAFLAVKSIVGSK